MIFAKYILNLINVRSNPGNNVDILLNVHDVFQGPAARDNAGNNIDILLNVHDVFQGPSMHI
jgi:hypothetical protein